VDAVVLCEVASTPVNVLAAALVVANPTIMLSASVITALESEVVPLREVATWVLDVTAVLLIELSAVGPNVDKAVLEASTLEVELVTLLKEDAKDLT
jgi:hypothetical protein